MTNAEKLDTPIAELQRWGLPTRILEALDEVGVIYVRHLVGATKRDLLLLKNISDGACDALANALGAFLTDEPPTKTARQLIESQRGEE